MGRNPVEGWEGDNVWWGGGGRRQCGGGGWEGDKTATTKQCYEVNLITTNFVISSNNTIKRFFGDSFTLYTLI